MVAIMSHANDFFGGVLLHISLIPEGYVFFHDRELIDGWTQINLPTLV